MAAAGLPLPQHQGHHDVLQLIPAIPIPTVLLLISLGSLNKLTWPPLGKVLHTTHNSTKTNIRSFPLLIVKPPQYV